MASRTLVLESKRFYLDVKENQRGRFIKIAEISADGRKVMNSLSSSTNLNQRINNIFPQSSSESNFDDILHSGCFQPEFAEIY